MKQKIVIQVCMHSEKRRSKALRLAAKADEVISVGITGDDKDELEVVGDGFDAVCLASCLRRKLGHADILQVEEVMEEEEEEEEPAKDDLWKPVDYLRQPVHPPLQCYPADYHYYSHRSAPPGGPCQ